MPHNSIQEPPLNAARRAILLLFLVCGIGFASWAPMVPQAKIRLELNDASLGIVLLCMGAGALVIMPFMGAIIGRFGSKNITLIAGLIISAILPALLLAPTALLLGMALFIFGLAIGAIDVAMNTQAVIIQERFGKYIMSSFHGMFSLGGLIGSMGLGFLIKIGLSAYVAILCVSILLVIISLSQFKNLFPHTEKTPISTSSFTVPKGAVLILGMMCFVVFLAEGAMLDWSAVFLQFHRGFQTSTAGLGFAVFSVAMAIMRLTGDRLTNYVGQRKIVLIGGIVAALGFVMAVTFKADILVLTGFGLVGLGCANIVPVFFSSAGNLPNVSPNVALSGITTMGYTGLLAGPAIIGFIAETYSLSFALGCVSIALLIVALAFKENK